MKRKYIAERFTDEEFLNLKEGKCWCGKPKEEFQPGMKVFCSPEHRTIWYSKVLTWQEFKNEFLKQHGRYCDMCGKHDTDVSKIEQEYNDALQKIIDEYYDTILREKINKDLIELSEWYERRYNDIVSQKTVDKYDAEKFAKNHKIPLPSSTSEIKIEKYNYEVDHKIAIANGGKEFDWNNLQVLCEECHRKKTKRDLALRREYLVTLPLDEQIKQKKLYEEESENEHSIG